MCDCDHTCLVDDRDRKLMIGSGWELVCNIEQADDPPTIDRRVGIINRAQ